MAQQAPTPQTPRPATDSRPAEEVRSAGTRPCPNCGATASVNATVCSACGESLPSLNKQVRCRRCGGKASAALVVCPHCGRNLQPAPPRLLTWGAPIALVLLFGAALLMQLAGSGPIAWSQRQVQRLTGMVNSIGERLQPEFTITTYAPADSGADQLVSQPGPVQAVAQASDTSAAASSISGEAAPGAAQAAETTSEIVAVEIGTATSEAELPTATATIAATPTSEPTATAIPPTETPLPSPTVTRTPTSAPTNTPLIRMTPTVAVTTRPPLASAAAVSKTAPISVTASLALALPTPTPPVLTPTATPNVYRIRAGDTLFDLALDNDISLEALLEANGLTEDDVYTIQPGDDIIIPDPNATVEPTATATPTETPAPEGVTYTVAAGDTLMAIGLRFGLNIQQILDANGLTVSQARSLRPGQVLIIPQRSETAATATPQATATSVAIATPTTAATTSAVRLDAPGLRSPENGTSVQCGSGGQLAWSAVPFIQTTDVYVVHLGYVNGLDAGGNEQVVWVLDQQRPSNATLWQLDDSLCGLAPLEYGRQWRWYVDVAEKSADGTLTPVSLPSNMWGFTWQ